MTPIKFHTFKIHTLGCKVNQYESQAIRERLQRLGLKENQFQEKADISIINTCTVTQSADRKSRNAIRQALNKNSRAKVVVTGCLVKFDKDMLGKIKGIDYIIPKSFFSDGISNFSHHSRAFVKIQDGCDNRCSFCKVSLVRGKSRSRPETEIIDEVKKLLSNGFKEIVLTGVCLGSFGLDLSPKSNLASLIEKLEKLPGLKRIRLSSIEPNLLSKELIDLFSSSAKLCPHLHIPLQSGSNKILKLMNRNYTREFFLSLIERIRAEIAHIGITTDVLVGFPGEEEEDFRNTLQVLNQTLPLRVHCFTYSPRLGTIAAGLRQTIFPRDELSRRMNELRVLSGELSIKFRNFFLNKQLDVLVEKLESGQLSGYSSNYIRVSFSGNSKYLNQIVPVRVEEVGMELTKASIIESQQLEEQAVSRCYNYS